MIYRKLKSSLTVAFILSVVLFATRASAVPVTWNESGDAGNTPSTAQTPIGTGQLDIIVEAQMWALEHRGSEEQP